MVYTEPCVTLAYLQPLYIQALQSFKKYLRQTLVFSTTGEVQFLFFRRFLLVLTKFYFWEEDQALGNNSIMF